jgi:hypothetical protein
MSELHMGLLAVADNASLPIAITSESRDGNQLIVAGQGGTVATWRTIISSHPVTVTARKRDFKPFDRPNSPNSQLNILIGPSGDELNTTLSTHSLTMHIPDTSSGAARRPTLKHLAGILDKEMLDPLAEQLVELFATQPAEETHDITYTADLEIKKKNNFRPSIIRGIIHAYEELQSGQLRLVDVDVSLRDLFKLHATMAPSSEGALVLSAFDYTAGLSGESEKITDPTAPEFTDEQLAQALRVGNQLIRHAAIFFTAPASQQVSHTS